LTVCLFDTSSLRKLAYLRAANPKNAIQVIEALNRYVTTAYVPLLAMMEAVRSSHARYQYARRVAQVTLEAAIANAGQAHMVVAWCNGQPAAPTLPDHAITRWPLNAPIRMVPMFKDCIGDVILDLASTDNYRCTLNEGFHVVASSIDHLILGTARHLRATLITQDQNLSAAADHLGVPYRQVEGERNFCHLWHDCAADQTCLSRIIQNDRAQLGDVCQSGAGADRPE